MNDAVKKMAEEWQRHLAEAFAPPTSHLGDFTVPTIRSLAPTMTLRKMSRGEFNRTLTALGYTIEPWSKPVILTAGNMRAMGLSLAERAPEALATWARDRGEW